MSKNRRVALSHAVHLALHGSLRTEQIVDKATEFSNFLDDLPSLLVAEADHAAIGEQAALYERQLCGVANHPVIGLRKKNARELLEVFEPLPTGEEVTVGMVLQAGPRYLFDIGVSEKRRGKILEDLYSLADALEVELSDVEAYLSVDTSLWSNGHEDYLFNGDAERAAQVAESEDKAEPSMFLGMPIQTVKPRCGCEDHTPYSAEELPGVRISQLDVSTEAVDTLAGRGIETVGDLGKAGPVSVIGLDSRDQAVLASFALALNSAREEAAPVVNESAGYLDLPIDSFADIHPDLLADLQSKGVLTLRNLVENPLLIPEITQHGFQNWIALTGHLMTGLNKELEELPVSGRERSVLTRKVAALQALLNVAKNMATDEKVEALTEKVRERLPLPPFLQAIIDRLPPDAITNAIKTGEPLIVAADSELGQKLMQAMKGGLAPVSMGSLNPELDPKFTALLDGIFNPKKAPTKH